MREFALLQHVYAGNAQLGAAVLVPPGDDMAMVQLAGSKVLAAVDQVVDGRHFRLDVTPIEIVGRKAITRCLSDVAAMATEPVAALAAVVLPKEFDEANALKLFEAMRATCELYKCPLVGGDISVHGKAKLPLTCSVTILSQPHRGRVILRSGAKVGDSVYVTSNLGGAIEKDGTGKHLAFEPRIQEALELSERLGDRLHAMIDISDGLGRDAGHIAEMSNVTIDLWAKHIPVNRGCDWRNALGDGEDYELCFTAVGDVPASICNVPISRIGQVVENTRHGDDGGGGGVWIEVDDAWQSATEFGWEHGT